MPPCYRTLTLQQVGIRSEEHILQAQRLSLCPFTFASSFFGVGLGGVVEALLLLVERLDVEVALETIDPPVRESAQ